MVNILSLVIIFVMLFHMFIYIQLILWLTCRRLSSRKVNNAGNSHVENAPDTYEMPTSGNDSSVQYATIQLEASAPAQSTNVSTSSEPAPGSSQHDTTLIENDLYE